MSLSRSRVSFASCAAAPKRSARSSCPVVSSVCATACLCGQCHTCGNMRVAVTLAWRRLTACLTACLTVAAAPACLAPALLQLWCAQPPWLRVVCATSLARQREVEPKRPTGYLWPGKAGQECARGSTSGSGTDSVRERSSDFSQLQTHDHSGSSRSGCSRHGVSHSRRQSCVAAPTVAHTSAWIARVASKSATGCSCML